MSKKVLVVSYYFYPDQAVGAKRATELARSMTEEGWDVEVITKYIGKAPREARVNNDSIGKIHSIYQHPGIINPMWALVKRLRGNKKGQAQPIANPETPIAGEAEARETLKFRAKRYIISTQATLNACKAWVLASILFLIYLKARGRRYDAVITSSPLSSSHLIGLTARSLFRATWIMDIRDPINMWEEVLPICRSQLRRKVETDLERIYYKKSDVIVVTSPSLKVDLCGLDIIDEDKVHLIYNGYDGDLRPKKEKETDTIRMIYAGALYFNRDPFPVFEAIRDLASEGVIRSGSFVFDLFGDCKNWNNIDLEAWVARNGVDHLIKFHGNVTAEELEPQLQSADILLNLAQGQKKQIPAKTFEYLKFQAEQFLVSEPDSDIAQFLSSHNFGVVADSKKEDVKEKLKAALYEVNNESMLHRFTEESLKGKYSRKNQNKNYISVINHAF